MAAISDILLAIKNLSPTDLHAFSTTAKKCVDEAASKKLAEIPTMSPVGDAVIVEAAPIAVSQTFPFIYVSNDDLEKAKKFDPLKYTDISNPIVENGFYLGSAKMSLLFQGKYINQLSGLPAKIESTFPKEKPVFIYTRTGSHQPSGFNAGTDYGGRFFTITNYGNIYSMYTSFTAYNQPQTNTFSPRPQPILGKYPDYISEKLLEVDELCRVPQIFIDVITVTTRLFETTAVPNGSYRESPHSNEQQLKDRFKALCRQYVKSQFENKSKAEELKKDYILLEKQFFLQEEQLKEQKSAIKALEDEAVHQSSVIETQRNELEQYRAHQCTVNEELTACRDEIAHYRELLRQQRQTIQTQQTDLEMQKELLVSQQDELDTQRKLAETPEKPQVSSWKMW